MTLALAASTLLAKQSLEPLKLLSAVGICLAWVQLIFLLGRYPFLGGQFSIMFYTITKRIASSALGFLILVSAFAFAFFIIHFGSESTVFASLGTFKYQKKKITEKNIFKFIWNILA